MWGHGGLFADWSEYLERWAAADAPIEARPPQLSRDDFDAATWDRLLTLVQEALNLRLDRWSGRVSRHLGECTDEFSWGRALSQAREGLSSVLALCRAPELPADVSELLCTQVGAVITANQHQLERDAQQDLRGPRRRVAEMQMRQLRRNPLTAVLSAPTLPPPDRLPAGPPPAGPGRRRQIIVDKDVTS